MFIENENLMAKIAINRSLLKEYKTNSDSRVVYMNNNDEFQIQLFNPEQDTIGAEVSINGKTIPGILVIKPGERIWLERYLTENAKFKFTTYEVDDPDSDSSVAKAIQHNGEIEIKFYREKPQEVVKISSQWSPSWSGDEYFKISDYVCTHKSIDIPYKTMLNTTSDTIKCNDACIRSAISALDTVTTNSVETLSMNDEKCTIANNYSTSACASASANVLDYQSMLNASKDISAPIKRCKTVTNTTNDNGIEYYSSAVTANKTIETGRIGKGNVSNQYLQEVNISFQPYYFKREVIKILPLSRKQYSSSDMQKMYCTNCGRKLNTKFKYCPYCGSKCLLFID